MCVCCKIQHLKVRISEHVMNGAKVMVSDVSGAARQFASNHGENLSFFKFCCIEKVTKPARKDEESVAP